MRQALADRPDDLALLDVMEAGHAAIDALIETIDTALADRDFGLKRVAAATDAVAGALSGHLKHEEDEALPLIELNGSLGRAVLRACGVGVSVSGERWWLCLTARRARCA
jgi:hypothetical protein